MFGRPVIGGQLNPALTVYIPTQKLDCAACWGPGQILAPPPSTAEKVLLWAGQSETPSGQDSNQGFIDRVR